MPYKIKTKSLLEEKISGLNLLIAELRKENEFKDKYIELLHSQKKIKTVEITDIDEPDAAPVKTATAQKSAQCVAEQAFLREDMRLAVYGNRAVPPRNYTDNEIKSMIKKMLEKNKPQSDNAI
jgi:hypothetical protein